VLESVLKSESYLEGEAMSTVYRHTLGITASGFCGVYVRGHV